MSFWWLLVAMGVPLGLGLYVLLGPLWRQTAPKIVLPPPSTSFADDAEEWLKIPEH